MIGKRQLEDQICMKRLTAIIHIRKEVRLKTGMMIKTKLKEQTEPTIKIIFLISEILATIADRCLIRSTLHPPILLNLHRLPLQVMVMQKKALGNEDFKKSADNR